MKTIPVLSLMSIWAVVVPSTVQAQVNRPFGNPAQRSQVERTEEPMPVSTEFRSRMPVSLGVPGKSLFDRVMPENFDSSQTVGVNLGESSEFQIFHRALKVAGLEGVLDRKGPYTVFAPTDEAFRQLPDGVLAEWFEPSHRATLRRILLGHVVSGKTMSSDFRSEVVSTSAGTTLSIAVGQGAVMVNEATLEETDHEASNGVVHAVNTVIIPEVRPGQ
ncbi:putative surface protein with fasciclin (FAS1) repeats [Haloferula luteola]|uniref:Putative surface protein with fasciclin (FAS1) repeats n=1 Tax=Haloferula luteola TaxID=595692 RepID=A0A840V715_9BACT|nr:fasciclin domain-containing protein [Haloferula luteola]MBB5351394.1 putative surface protein with fasciclin (FAS1) repeats [Haloferula luteola]